MYYNFTIDAGEKEAYPLLAERDWQPVAGAGGGGRHTRQEHVQDDQVGHSIYLGLVL